MQAIVASVEGYDLEIDTFLQEQVGLRNLPFYGMDKSRASICEYYMKDTCARLVLPAAPCTWPEDCSVQALAPLSARRETTASSYTNMT